MAGTNVDDSGDDERRDLQSEGEVSIHDRCGENGYRRLTGPKLMLHMTHSSCRDIS